jgi:hypothetical protein
VLRVAEGIDEAAAQSGTGLMTTAPLSSRKPDGVASSGRGPLGGDALPTDLLPVGIAPVPVAIESALADGPYRWQLEDESLGLAYLTPEVQVEGSPSPLEVATPDSGLSLVAPEVPQVAVDWDVPVETEARRDSDLTGGPTDPRSAATGTAGQAQTGAGQDGGRRDSSADRGSEAARRAADVGPAPEGETRAESVDSAVSALGSWSPVVRAMQESTGTAGLEPARPLAEQIERALSRAMEQPGQSLRLLLEPEGLGMMQLRVELSGAGVRVSFMVEHADTANLVEATWQQLSAAFEQRGLTVDQVLVDLLGDNRWADGPAFGQSTADRSRTPAAPRRSADRAEARGELAPTALQEVTTRIDYRV